MISELEARKIVNKYLEYLEVEVGEPLRIIEKDILERSFGWVYFYNSKEYLDTGEFIYMLAGNSPLIIDRKSGEVIVTGTDKPINDYLSEYENNWEN